MDFTTFHKSISASAPPTESSVYLQALWHDARGHWKEAHELVQDLPDTNAAWIHAYLHRKEGDLWNADYWYKRAGQTRASSTLQEEWKQLVKALL